MTGLIHTLLGIALASGSLSIPYEQAKDLIDYNTGAVFMATTGCDQRLYATHSDTILGVKIQRKLRVGDRISDGPCRYEVIERKIVMRIDTKLKLTPGISWVQTCWTDDAKEILIITMKSLNS